jgi:hypothetical protein
MSSTAKSLIFLGFFFEFDEPALVQGIDGGYYAVDSAALVGQPGHQRIASDADEVKKFHVVLRWWCVVSIDRFSSIDDGGLHSSPGCDENCEHNNSSSRPCDVDRCCAVWHRDPGLDS